MSDAEQPPKTATMSSLFVRSAAASLGPAIPEYILALTPPACKVPGPLVGMVFR